MSAGHINIKAVGDRVGIDLDGKARGLMAWEEAQTISRELRALAGASIGMVVYKFMVDGRPVYVDLEIDIARQVADGLYACSLLAEEQAKAESIAMDTAILYRSGAPFGLSDDPRIKDLAKKEAAWNSDLRRAMAGGVKSAEAFGVPTVTNIKH